MKAVKHTFTLALFLLITSVSIAFGNRAKLQVGDKAPDFTVTDPNGNTLSLSSLKGKVVLLDFWASWCMPCRMANLEFVQLYKEFQPYGFEIFSLSLDSRKIPWLNAIKNDKLEWPYHGSELTGWEGSKIAASYGVEAIPATYLINEHGIIIGIGLDEYDIEKKLKYIFFEQVNFYPQTATSKLFFTGKAKYEIIDTKGTTLLKGKAEEVDITGIPAGEYTIVYENKKEKFHKLINSQSLPEFYPTRVDDIITINRESDFEIYTTRGKLEKKGKGTIVDVTNLRSGVYYISIDGNVSSFYKK
ncbi:MAG TPA: redoxin domain-containing protein [Cytophagaceae bacterium]